MPSETPRQGLSVDCHKPLKVSDNKRYLVHQDGTPFFYLACTAWELFHRLNREEAEIYLENRRQKGFTVIQAVVLAELDGLDTPNPYSYKPLINKDPTTPNDDYFKHVDYIVNKAQDKGIYIGMVPTWGDKVGPALWGQGPEGLINTTNARIFGQFLGKRYKNSPNIIWILGGDRPAKGYEAVWREMVQGIKAGDEGRHLVTYHTLGGKSSSVWFHKEEWLDFNMLQSSHHARDLPNYKLVSRDYKKSPTKPTLDSEPRYEGHPVGWQPKKGYFDDYDVRQAAYWGVFAGGMGTAYGANPIWQMYAPQRSPNNHVRTYWYDSLDFNGAWDMMHLRHLMESRPFSTGVPAQFLIAGWKGRGANHVRATQGDGYAFIYIPTGKKVRIRLGKISSNQLKAWWFNPRTGEASLISIFPSRGTKEFTPLGESGRGNDWVLVLDDTAKNFPAPGCATSM
jgi:hypothetical protein